MRVSKIITAFLFIVALTGTTYALGSADTVVGMMMTAPGIRHCSCPGAGTCLCTGMAPVNVCDFDSPNEYFSYLRTSNVFDSEDEENIYLKATEDQNHLFVTDSQGNDRIAIDKDDFEEMWEEYCED